MLRNLLFPERAVATAVKAKANITAVDQIGILMPSNLLITRMILNFSI
jgi:hypothetical protein